MEKPIDPQTDGYLFGGWFKEPGCVNEWNFENDTVTANVTLYAKWTEVLLGSEGCPWKVGSPNAVDVLAWTNGTTLVIKGTGAMDDFADAAEVPWGAVADKVAKVTVAEGVMLGQNALTVLSDDVLVTSTLPIGSLKGALGVFAGTSLPEGTIPVSKTELEAAGAATLTIVDGTAYVGVSVRTNGDLTAKTKSWGKVKFDKDVRVDVSEDGTEIVIPVPANAQQGFMILESKPTEK